MKKTRIDRRKFIKVSSISGSGLILGFLLPGFRSVGKAVPDCEFFQPNTYLRIDKKGIVTLFVARQEMGQGINTSLPMIVSEELECDFSKVKIEPLPYGTFPVDKGNQHDTAGSQSVIGSWNELRKAGATAKSMLITAAAKKWAVNENTCIAEKGSVIHSTSGNSISFGELVCDAALLPVPAEVRLKNIKDFKLIGQGQRKKNIKGIITGNSKFGIDLKVPGMVYAVVQRSPVLGATIIHIDDTAAKKITGVIDVISYAGTHHPMHVRSGVAVIATNIWSAIKARKLLNVQWNEGIKNTENSENLFKTFAQKANEKPGYPGHNSGDVGKQITTPGQSVQATYSAPFLAHATMEPMSFIASVNNDQCELWGALQLPDWAVTTISKECNIKPENIKLNLAMAGGGFGRRLMCDFAIEAVKIAQKIHSPVKVLWDRADDMRYANYRPANFHSLRATWNNDKKVQTWKHHVLTTSIDAMLSGPDMKDPSELGGGAGVDFWYDIPNVNTGYTHVDFNLHRGWLRGVDVSVNIFAIESFVDEIAAKLKKDPLDFRLSLLEGRLPFKAQFNKDWYKNQDPGRIATVLKLAAEKIGWKEPAKKNHFKGIACVSYIHCDAFAAHAVEIELLAPKKFRIKKVVATIDCGVVIDPDGLKNQMEGGIVFGLSQALKSQITVKNGRVEQDSFATYEVLRYNEMPDVEVHIVASDERPGGVGEVGVPTVTPALCNALAAAGYRPRRLPIRNEGFEWI